uniref:AAA family ATPase n=1 Tax=Ignisphaera aggregans TaxID=334771 RepID=A0A7J2U2L5_9CREN
MTRIKLSFAPGLEIEFTDRDRAIEQVLEWSEKSTPYPVVVFGPEGCGKTSLLLQAVEILREQGYSVIYFNPLRRRFEAEAGIESIKQLVLDRLRQASTEHEFARLIWLVIDVAVEALKHGKKKLAIIVDDAFHFMGIKEAAAIVKGLLELIEHPEEKYEKIVAIAATSEGLSRTEIGRHRWAELTPMWNMSRKGFEELYKRVPGSKPSFDEVWRLTGGNPDMLRRLYLSGWSVNAVIEKLIDLKKLDIFVSSLSSDERKWLAEVVEDPDTLYTRERIPLLHKLVELNLIVDEIPRRDRVFWIDELPPERDHELGIGKLAAWQTPLHREAVKKVLKKH